ncbi:MAG: DUF4239 domain-containing protein [Deltaproteobacteria bacterium]|nr:DUF4239 domain-containing protein [Deltaproteobacteria bacterium]
MNPIAVSAIIFCCIFGGALLGMLLRDVLPEHHLNADTKELVKLGVGLIGTMSALLLGLLVASAKSSYDQRSAELTQMAANIILLDRALAHYGPATGETRGMLRTALTRMIDQVWSNDTKRGTVLPQTGMDVVFDKLQELVPRTDAQHMLQSQAESIMINFGQERSLLFAQSGSSISTPFLMVVVFWLTVLFVSFGLFAPRNATAIVTLLISAISVAAALFLIMELDRPFSGAIQISSVPLRNALTALGH